MEFNLKKSQIACCKCIYETAAEQGINLEFNLPDYCSDIKRILKCVVEPGINSVSVSGERATAAGEITIRLIYVNENEKIDCFEKKTELSRYVDMKGIGDTCSVLASASVEYVNCRAASQRRFNVSGTVAIHFSAYEKQKSEFLSDIEGKGSQIKTKVVSCNDLVSFGDKCFDMSETIAIASDKKPIGRLLRCDAYATVQSLKAVSGKLLIKGELTVDILYCNDSDSAELEKLRHTMPISQIADIADIDESSLCDVSLCVRSLVVEPRADSSGGNRLLEIACKICAFVKAYGKTEARIITDCYSTKGKLEAQKSDFVMCTDIQCIEKSKDIKKTTELSGQSIKQVIDIRTVKTTALVTEKGSEHCITAVTVFSIIFTDSDGKYQYCERNIEYDFDDIVQAKNEKIICEPKITVCNEVASISQADKIEISFEARLNAFVYVTDCKKACVEAQYIDEEEKENCALTICFSSKDDEIWKIAKKYKTTVKAICEENALNGDTLDEDRMLMVPIV